ncbi:hypothetical protein LDENG_00076820 [Lucifuga dentata]|nr:hypothetical protein LDENG_00076820 [Lucifuga dentata]
MPELNSNSLPSNSHAGALNSLSCSPTCPLGVFMAARCSPHTHNIDSHPLRAPPKPQHYPHLLHYYALLSPCSSVVLFLPLTFHRLPPYICYSPRMKRGSQTV